MELSVRSDGTRTVVSLPGPRLDASRSGDFKRQMVELIDSGARRIVLDLSEVDFIDSSGLGAVVGCFKHVGQHGTLELACLSPAVDKIFDLTRMNRVFTIHEEVPSA